MKDEVIIQLTISPRLAQLLTHTNVSRVRSFDMGKTTDKQAINEFIQIKKRLRRLLPVIMEDNNA